MEATTLEALHAEDLTMSQGRVLLGLSNCSDPMPVSDVAAMVGLSAAATGRLVDRLVGQGLVRREESSIDRRVKLVALTDRGRDGVLDHRAAKARVARKLLDELTPAEADALTSALQPLMPPVQEN